MVYSVCFARRYFDPSVHPAADGCRARRDRGRWRTGEAARLTRLTWSDVGRLLAHRQIAGVCLGQFAVHSTLTFFLTWFPSYLVTERHIDWIRAGFMASLPYVAAFVGVLVAGFWSDRLLTRGASISVARKVPVITGLLVATVIVAANYVESSALIVTVLAVAFFAQGMSGTSWAAVSEIAPPEQLGLVGGLVQCRRQPRRHRDAGGDRHHRRCDRILRRRALFRWRRRAVRRVRVDLHRGSARTGADQNERRDQR